VALGHCLRSIPLTRFDLCRCDVVPRRSPPRVPARNFVLDFVNSPGPICFRFGFLCSGSRFSAKAPVLLISVLVGRSPAGSWVDFAVAVVRPRCLQSHARESARPDFFLSHSAHDSAAGARLKLDWASIPRSVFVCRSGGPSVPAHSVS
jgi:hypothetical protein